jgi:hypothetical protein
VFDRAAFRGLLKASGRGTSRKISTACGASNKELELRKQCRIGGWRAVKVAHCQRVGRLILTPTERMPSTVSVISRVKRSSNFFLALVMVAAEI